MKLITIFLMLSSMGLVGATSGQHKAQESSLPLVVLVPSDIGLPVIVYQPDCPLQIEDVQLFRYIDGGGGESYKVRNKSNKPIRSYTIGTWNTVGTGGEVERRLEQNLLPNQVATLVGNEVKVVELTETLRNQLNLRGEMRAIVVFMVLRAEYTDGSIYNNVPVYEALKTHLDKISQ